MIYAHNFINFSYKEKKDTFIVSILSQFIIFLSDPPKTCIMEGQIFAYYYWSFDISADFSPTTEFQVIFCIIGYPILCAFKYIWLFESSYNLTRLRGHLSQEWPRWPPFLFHILFPPMDLFLYRNFKGRFIVKIHEPLTTLKFPKKHYRSVQSLCLNLWEQIHI